MASYDDKSTTFLQTGSGDQHFPNQFEMLEMAKLTLKWPLEFKLADFLVLFKHGRLGIFFFTALPIYANQISGCEVKLSSGG